MIPCPARLRLSLLFPVVLLGGIVAGAGLRLAGVGGGMRHPWLAGTGAAASARFPDFHPGAADDPHLPAAGSPPFSMERFHAARGLAVHRMLARVLPGADAARVRALAEDLTEREEPPSDTSPVWKAIMARWVRLNAPEALAWGRAADARAKAKAEAGADPDPDPDTAARKAEDQKEEDQWSGSPLASAALQAWTGTDPEAAIAATATVTPGARAENPAESRAILEVLSETDPGRALRLAAQWGTPDKPLIIRRFDSSDEDRLLPKWAAQDPQAALAYIMGKKPEARGDLMDELALGWAVKDAKGCGAWIASLEPELKTEAINGLARAGRENPAGAARVLSGLPMDPNVRNAGRDLAAAWAEKAPQEALAWVRGRFAEGPLRANALAMVADTVMRTDPRTAAAIMDEMGWQPWSREVLDDTRVVSPGKDGDSITFKNQERDDWERLIYWGHKPSPESVIGDLLERLGQEDPALGVRCFEKAPASAQARMLENFGPAWFRQDPAAAMQWLASVPARQVNAEGMETMLKRLPEFTPAAMTDWALRLPPGPLREALAAQSTASVPVQDPETALAQLPFTDPASRSAAAAGIFSQWAEEAPREAAERMILDPHPPSGVLRTAVGNWTDRDPAAASAWTAALPPGPGREAAIGGLITSLSHADREPDLPAALAWSLDLSDPAQRLKAARELLTGLFLSAPEPAVQEIRETLDTTSALSDQDRRALLELIPP